MSLEKSPGSVGKSSRSQVKKLLLGTLFVAACNESKPLRPAGYIHFDVGAIEENNVHSLVYVIGDQSIKSQAITAQVLNGLGSLTSRGSSQPTSTLEMDRICCPSGVTPNAISIVRLLDRRVCTRIGESEICDSTKRETNVRVADFFHSQHSSHVETSRLWFSVPLSVEQGGGVMAAGLHLTSSSVMANHDGR